MRFSTRQLIERLSLSLGAGTVGIAILVSAAALSHSYPARQEVAIVVEFRDFWAITVGRP